MKTFNENYICQSSQTITSEYVGLTVAVHNGRLYQNFIVKSKMVGYKFGAFITSKKLGPAIHISATRKGKKTSK